MRFRRTAIPVGSKVKSLCWRGDSLVDWVAGGREFRLDGSTTPPVVLWGYRFDAAIQSRSGRFIAIYEKLGTKALILKDGVFLREVNRSFYHADAYEYPIAFALHSDGTEVVIHCPDDYCKLDVDDADTGQRLTIGINRKPADFFHSRLAVSPDNRWLLSAGWIWHPFNSVCWYDVRQALENASVLDPCNHPGLETSGEVDSAAFLDSHRLLLASGPQADDFQDDCLEGLKPGHFGVFDLETCRFQCLSPINQPLGTIMPLGNDHLVSFYDYPKVIHLASGSIVAAWPDVKAGQQASSIIWHHSPPPPPIAMDPANLRFAVAEPQQITVIELEADLD